MAASNKVASGRVADHTPTFGGMSTTGGTMGPDNGFMLHDIAHYSYNVSSWLTVEHDSNGTHRDVNARSITLRKPTPSELGGGYIATAQIDADGDTHVLGSVTVGHIDSDVATVDGYGVKLGPGDSFHDDWSILADRDSFARLLGIYNETNGSKILALYNQGGGVYSLGPFSAGLTTVNLGHNLNSDFFWNAAYIKEVHARTAIYERLRTAALGEFVPIDWDSANFTASAGTWTVDEGEQITYGYELSGDMMHLVWDLATTDVSAGGVLRVGIPGGYSATHKMSGTHIATDNGGASVSALCRVLAGGTYVELYATAAGGSFAATGADNTSVAGSLRFPVTTA